MLKALIDFYNSNSLGIFLILTIIFSPIIISIYALWKWKKWKIEVFGGNND